MDDDFNKHPLAQFIQPIANAQAILAIAVATALDQNGLVSIDEFTRVLEQANVSGTNEGTNSFVEGWVDALRDVPLQNSWFDANGKYLGCSRTK